MLCITLQVGESILAENLFELRFQDSVGSSMKFEIVTVETKPFLTVGRAGGLVGGLSYPKEPGQFTVLDGGRLKTHGCEITFERVREGVVKLGIIAPRSVRISRPHKHGTSLRSA